jgi:hypothetical protein
MRLTFTQVQSYARENNFWIDKQGSKYVYGDGGIFCGEANSLHEAWDELYGAIHDKNVLAAGK